MSEHADMHFSWLYRERICHDSILHHAIAEWIVMHRANSVPPDLFTNDIHRQVFLVKWYRYLVRSWPSSILDIISGEKLLWVVNSSHSLTLFLQATYTSFSNPPKVSESMWGALIVKDKKGGPGAVLNSFNATWRFSGSGWCFGG